MASSLGSKTAVPTPRRKSAAAKALVSVAYFSTFDMLAGFSFAGKRKWAATKTAHLFGDFLSLYYVVQKSETIIRICVSKKL